MEGKKALQLFDRKGFIEKIKNKSKNFSLIFCCFHRYWRKSRFLFSEIFRFRKMKEQKKY